MFNSPPPSDYEGVLVQGKWQYVKEQSLDTSKNIYAWILGFFGYGRRLVP